MELRVQSCMAKSSTSPLLSLFAERKMRLGCIFRNHVSIKIEPLSRGIVDVGMPIRWMDEDPLFVRHRINVGAFTTLRVRSLWNQTELPRQFVDLLRRLARNILWIDLRGRCRRRRLRLIVVGVASEKKAL